MGVCFGLCGSAEEDADFVRPASGSIEGGKRLIRRRTSVKAMESGTASHSSSSARAPGPDAPFGASAPAPIWPSSPSLSPPSAPPADICPSHPPTQVPDAGKAELN